MSASRFPCALRLRPSRPSHVNVLVGLFLAVSGDHVHVGAGGNLLRSCPQSFDIGSPWPLRAGYRPAHTGEIGMAQVRVREVIECTVQQRCRESIHLLDDGVDDGVAAQGHADCGIDGLDGCDYVALAWGEGAQDFDGLLFLESGLGVFWVWQYGGWLGDFRDGQVGCLRGMADVQLVATVHI